MGDQDDRDPADTPEDPDRKAILARRNRFIAVALTGLSTALVGCDKKAPPTACLEPLPPESGTPEPCLEVVAEEEGGDEPEEPDEGQPIPCLSPMPDDPRPPDDPPPDEGQGQDRGPG